VRSVYAKILLWCFATLVLEGTGRSPIRTIRGVGYLFAAVQEDET
jgi:hypothetical protein